LVSFADRIAAKMELHLVDLASECKWRLAGIGDRGARVLANTESVDTEAACNRRREVGFAYLLCVDEEGSSAALAYPASVVREVELHGRLAGSTGSLEVITKRSSKYL
jgi:hypothetical protein